MIILYNVTRFQRVDAKSSSTLCLQLLGTLHWDFSLSDFTGKMNEIYIPVHSTQTTDPLLLIGLQRRLLSIQPSSCNLIVGRYSFGNINDHFFVFSIRRLRSLGKFYLPEPWGFFNVRVMDKTSYKGLTFHLGYRKIPIRGVFPEEWLVPQYASNPPANDDTSPVTEETSEWHPCRRWRIMITCIMGLKAASQAQIEEIVSSNVFRAC